MGKHRKKSHALRRSAVVGITAASMVSVGFGAWADTVSLDGDTAASDPNLQFGPTSFQPCSQLGLPVAGQIVVKYNGSGRQSDQHAGVNDTLDVSFAYFDSSNNTTTLVSSTADTAVVPSDWGTATTQFPIDFTTTVDPSFTGGHVEVTVQDLTTGWTAGADGGQGKPQFNISVDSSCSVGTPPTSVSPSIDWSSSTSHPSSANEGDSETYTFTVTDGDSSSWNFVNGSPSCGTDGSLVANSASITGTSGTFQCDFIDGFTGETSTVIAQVSDGTNNSNTLQQLVAVANVNPTVNSVLLSNNTGTACIGGNSVNLGFTFTDPGVIDNPWTPTIAWGDSSTNTTSPTVGAQTGSAPWTVSTGTYTHTYSAGTYTPSVLLTDKDSGIGSATSATTGAVSFTYANSGLLQPINSDKSSNFKLGSVFPVKIKITDCNGAPVSSISPQVKLQQMDSSDTGVVNETVATSVPDLGNYMRYDSTAGQWIYNLSTKRTTLVPSGALTTGNYKVTVYDTAGTFTPAVGYFQIIR